jgi:hypothetical protein
MNCPICSQQLSKGLKQKFIDNDIYEVNCFKCKKYLIEDYFLKEIQDEQKCYLRTMLYDQNFLVYLQKKYTIKLDTIGDILNWRGNFERLQSSISIKDKLSLTIQRLIQRLNNNPSDNIFFVQHDQFAALTVGAEKILDMLVDSFYIKQHNNDFRLTAKAFFEFDKNIQDIYTTLDKYIEITI